MNMDSVRHSLHNVWRSTAETVMPVLSTSGFREKGVRVGLLGALIRLVKVHEQPSDPARFHRSSPQKNTSRLGTTWCEHVQHGPGMPGTQRRQAVTASIYAWTLMLARELLQGRRRHSQGQVIPAPQQTVPPDPQRCVWPDLVPDANIQCPMLESQKVAC